MITTKIQYVGPYGEPVTDDEISRIHLVSETEHAVIIHVETKVKYPEVQAYMGNGVMFKTKVGNMAHVFVEGLPDWDLCIVIAEASRYGMYIICFSEGPANPKWLFVQE